MRYYCADCLLAVIVVPDLPPIRGCACAGPIVAEASAVLEGAASLGTS